MLMEGVSSMRSAGTKPLTAVSRASRPHSQQTARVLDKSSAAHITSEMRRWKAVGSRRGQARKAAVCVSSSGQGRVEGMAEEARRRESGEGPAIGSSHE